MKPNRISYALILLLVASCATVVPNTPRESLAATYALIKSVAQSVGMAKQNGTITDNRKNELLDDLQAALTNTKQAELALNIYEQSVQDGVANETEQQKYIRYMHTANSVLLLLQKSLQESSDE